MKIVTFLIIVSVIASCTMPKEKIPASMPDLKSSGSKIIIYQMMVRLFGNTNTTNKKYGTIEENGVGKFNDVNISALTAIKELGVTHIWYTGVIEHALLTDYTRFGILLDDADVVKGRAGSPYSIKDYYDVNPDLAVDVKNRIKEFELLIERTHAQDLRAIIDFVPNHVARAYHSDAKPDGVKDLGEEDDSSVAFRADNNFYYLTGQSFQPPAEHNSLGPENAFPARDGEFDESPAKATGNDQFTASPGVNEWFETVKINYGVDILSGRKSYFDPVPNTWIKMRDILIYWTKKKVDGFRCDMAEMVPVEFWNWAIPQVKAVNPEVIFIAEIYNPSEYRNYVDNGKFDFLYDKVQLYDTLRLLMNQRSGSPEIAGIRKSLEGLDRYMLHFLENHDEQRIASPFFAGDPWKAVSAMVVTATIDRGPVMIYFGQEVGEPAAGVPGYNTGDGVTTKFDYWGVPEHQKWVNEKKYDGAQLDDNQKQLRQFYQDILTLSRENKAVATGEYIDLTTENVRSKNFTEQYVSFGRVAGTEKLIILAGFNTTAERIKLKLTPEAIEKFGLTGDEVYIGRDLLRSGIDVGLNAGYEFELDTTPYGAYIFKIKQ